MKLGTAALATGGPRQRHPVDGSGAVAADSATVRQLPERVAAGAGKSLVARQSAGAPPVDSARVEALRAAMASGTFQLQPARIAEAMIATELAGRR